MGYVIIGDPLKGPVEVLGDEHGQQQARKALGLPYKNDRGRYVSEDELNLIDEMGE